MRRNENGEGFEHGGELVRGGGGRFLRHSLGQECVQTKIVGGNLLSNERKKIQKNYEILKQKKNGNGSRLRDKGLKKVKTFLEET
jgi:hypothetical protein